MYNIFSGKFLNRLNRPIQNPGVVTALYSNKLIQQVANGLLGIFLPVYLFQAYGSITSVLIFFLALYSIYLVLVAPAAKIASKISFKNSLIISVSGGSTFYLSLLFFDINIAAFSALAVVALIFDKLFYWTPYHSGLGKFLDRSHRGSIVGKIGAMESVIGVFTPVIAGLVLTYFGFDSLFVVAFIIYSISVVPLSVMPPINEYFSFDYLQTWKFLFHKRDWKILLTYMADGSQEMIGAVLWPIFIWQILSGDFEAVGILISLIVILTILIKLLMGRYTDKFDKKKLIKYGTIFYSLGWVAKAFVNTGFGIFIVSGYHNFAGIIMRTPYDALMYEKAADSGHYIDEYIVLRQMAMAVGRILTLVLLIGMFNFVDLEFAFILAAILSLFINFI